MKKTSLIILKLLLICKFLFTSCEKDEILTEPSMRNQNQLSKIFQNSFDSKQFTKTLPYKYNVDWSNPVKQYSEELETYFYEFPINYSDSYNPDVFNEQIKRDFYQKYKVVVTENEEGKFDFFIAKYFLKNIDGNTEVENSKLSLNTNKGYKGTIHLYDKEATITFAKHINNDKENKSFYSKNGKLNSAQAKWVNVCKTITTYHYKDWFWVVYDGYGRIISSTFLYTTFEGTSQKQECLQKWMPDPIIPKTPCTAFECNGVYYAFEPGIACEIGYKDDGLGNCVKVSTLNADDDFDNPPSCESFNFINITSNWQESAVQNIHFNIVVISPSGYHFSQIIEYPNAILFGTPTNLQIGNTTISSGLTANLSAKALQESMNETVSMYGNKPVSELTVRLYFEERLKHNYPLYIPGGRVNFNASSFIGAPTQYKTNMFGTGNCN